MCVFWSFSYITFEWVYLLIASIDVSTLALNMRSGGVSLYKVDHYDTWKSIHTDLICSPTVLTIFASRWVVGSRMYLIGYEQFVFS